MTGMTEKQQQIHDDFVEAYKAWATAAESSLGISRGRAELYKRLGELQKQLTPGIENINNWDPGIATEYAATMRQEVEYLLRLADVRHEEATALARVNRSMILVKEELLHGK